MAINIPSGEQWAKMNRHLASIAGALGSKMDISTWDGIQKAVRAGVAPELIPIGTQLQVQHSTYGTLTFDVVAHDYLKPAHNKSAHTMTLLCNTIPQAGSFSATQAFYKAGNSGLSAGTYSFTVAKSYMSVAVGTYNFTLTKAVPANGQLAFSSSPVAGMAYAMVGSYSQDVPLTPIETVSIKSGSAGTSLGTFGVELNAIDRCMYGSNNYKESAVRQFLNSDWIDEIWTPQTKFDRKPSWITSVSGFMYGMDKDFLDAVGEVVVPCASNGGYESPDSTVPNGGTYTVTDKFYLPSMTEIFGQIVGRPDGSVLLPFYEGATNTDRIKYGANTQWLTRTAATQSSFGYYVTSTGSYIDNYTSFTCGICPMCTIV